MRKIVIITILVTFLMSNFSVFAEQRKSLFELFNISKLEISAIEVRCVAYGIPELGEYTLEDKELIDVLITQLANMSIIENTVAPKVVTDPNGKLKIDGGGFEVTLKSQKSLRTFLISSDGEIAEYTSGSNNMPQFKYRISDEHINDWLWKLNRVSRVSQSQKQNIPLANKDDIKVFITIDDIKMQLLFDAQPKVVNGTTMIPARNVAEALGVRVEWNEKNQEVVLNGKWTLILRIGNVVPVFNPKSDVRLEVAPFVENGRTYVPLRFITEFYDKNVDYDDVTKTISITNPIINDWCINNNGNFKVKVYEDYTFEGFYQSTILGKRYNSAAFVIPFYNMESLSKQVVSIITAGRVLAPMNSLLDEITKNHAKDENYNINKISQNEYIVCYEYYEKKSDGSLSDTKRINVNYFKSDSNETLYVEVDCHVGYFEQNKEKLLENMKTIQKIK